MVTSARMPDRHLRGVDAGDAAAEDRDLGRGDAGNAAEQHAAAALLLLEIMGADLDRHAARDFAHRLEQRQRAGLRRHRLISDAGRARLHQPLGLRLVGGEVEIGEQDVPRLEQRDLLRLRLLDLDDHVGRLEHRRRVGKDLRAGLFIGLSGQSMPLPALVSTTTSWPCGDQLGDRGRRQPDAIFVDLDLLRHPDAHYSFAPLMMIARAYRRVFAAVPTDCGDLGAVLVGRGRDR